jgi:hypothetical protein
MAIVLFTATCMDAVFAVPLIAMMAAFDAALDDRPLGRGLAAGGAIDQSIAWWGLLAAVLLTLLSGLDYARVAPRVLRGRPA